MKRYLPPGHFFIEFHKLRESYEAGNIFSLLEAFIHFDRMTSEEAKPILKWIRDGVVKELRYRVLNGKTLHSGVSGNETGLAKNNIKHYARWLCVQSFMAEGFGVTQAIKKSEAYLTGTRYHGENPTIRKSYDIIKEALKDPEKKLRYIMPSFATLLDFDLEKAEMPKTHNVPSKPVLKK